MRFALHVAWLLSILACAGPGRAQTPEETAARQEFEAGRDAYDRGSFTSALAHFERAHALQPRPELLYNVGRAADSDGQASRAIEAYASYLESNPNAANADFVRARLAKMQALARAARPLPTVAQAMPSAAPPPRDEPRRPVWKRAWFWTTVGALVVGGVVTSVLLATRERTPERVEADAYALIPGTR
jgi:tetratricopeptide (TPR) repeat protein